MYGWFNRRFATPPDRFSEQHEHTLKLIASYLDQADYENLSKTSHKTRDMLIGSEHGADVHVDWLRNSGTHSDSDIQFILDSKVRAVGDRMSYSAYLKKYRFILDYLGSNGKPDISQRTLRFGDLTPILPRVYFYLATKGRETDQRAAQFKKSITDMCIIFPHSTLSFDGKFFNEPIAVTCSDNPPERMKQILYKHFESTVDERVYVPSSSLRMCKYLFDEVKSVYIDDAAKAVIGAVSVARDFLIQDSLVHIGEGILDRVDYVLTPELLAKISTDENDVEDMRETYALFHRNSPV